MKSIAAKYFPTALLLCLLAFGWSLTAHAQKVSKPKEVSISGKIAKKGTANQIFLDTLTGQRPWTYIVSPLSPAGEFSFKFPLEHTDIFRLRISDTNYVMLILSPGEKVSLRTNTKLGSEMKLEGSTHTRILNEAANTKMYYSKKHDSLVKVSGQPQPSQQPGRGSLVAKQLQANDSSFKSTLVKLMDKNPSSLAWLFFMDNLAMEKDMEVIEKVDEAMIKANPDNVFAKQFHQSIVSSRASTLGALAPEIALPDPDGNIRRLTDLRGKIVMIDFWASWCGPCRKENPNVVKLYNEVHDKGFEVFSVSLDKDKDSWLAAIARDNLVWKNHVSDLKYWKSAAAQTYGINSIPSTILLDRKGRIVAKGLRGEELDKKVKELLAN